MQKKFFVEFFLSVFIKFQVIKNCIWNRSKGSAKLLSGELAHERVKDASPSLPLSQPFRIGLCNDDILIVGSLFRVLT
jgi:hypothetical protein